MLNGVSLCSGYGGFDLALRLALGNRMRTVCYVEREADAAACLVARMDSEALDRAPVWDDLTTLDGVALSRTMGPIEWIAGGIPCQDHSTAGKRAGAEGARNLWPEFARLLVETGARFAFLENVPGLLSSTGRASIPSMVGNGLDRADAEPIRGGSFGGILADLAALGFDAEWCVLGADDVGAPHRRKRVWLFAWRRELGPRGVSDAFGYPKRQEQWREQPKRTGAAESGELGTNSAGPGSEAGSYEKGRSVEAGDRPGVLGSNVGGGPFRPNRSGNVANSEGRRRPPQGEWRETKEPEPVGAGEVLGDPDGRRRKSKRGGGVLDRERPALGGDTDRPSLWPPGPSDHEAWERVPPEAQPAIRGMAHGPAHGVERAARLRALGNGIVPLAGAVALRSLVRRSLQ